MIQKKETKTEAETLSQQIRSIVENFTKEYGEGVITTLEGSNLKNRHTLSTGSFILDQAIGGGYVFGRIIEIYGLEASGKTTLALHAVSECQRLGKKVAYIDVENALDIKYAKNLGIRTNELLLIHPDYGEQALDLVGNLVKEGVNLIIVDSVAALVPKAELEGDLERQSIGSQARMMANGLKKINSELTNKEVIVIFINQVRNKVSTSFFAGNPETTPGGVALSFFASLRIRLKEKKKIEKDGKYIGIETQVKVKKNKLASPYKEPILEIIFSQGIKREREIIDIALELNIIQKSGNWYSYKENKLGNGKENVTDYLMENPDLYQEIEKKVIDLINLEK